MAMFFKTITSMKLKIIKNKTTLTVRNLKFKVLYVLPQFASLETLQLQGENLNNIKEFYWK